MILMPLPLLPLPNSHPFFTEGQDFLTPSLFLPQDQADTLKDLAAHFEEIGHPNAGELRARQESLVSRFEELKEPLSFRRNKLNDQFMLLSICRDTEDEEAWIQETEPSAASTYLGQQNRAGGAIGEDRGQPVLRDLCACVKFAFRSVPLDSRAFSSLPKEDFLPKFTLRSLPPKTSHELCHEFKASGKN